VKLSRNANNVWTSSGENEFPNNIIAQFIMSIYDKMQQIDGGKCMQ
jgi:hypothetical protein